MNHKKLLLSLSFLLVMVVSAFSQANFQFEKTDHDFSFVREGNDTIWHEFTFKNTGNEPLIISDVKTSCDCTLAEWPKEAIQPGKTGVIRGGYKIAGKMGDFDKSIIITGNTSPAITILNLKGKVYKKNEGREG